MASDDERAFKASSWAASGLIAGLLLLGSGAAIGYDELVEKRVFEMDRYTTQGGEEIPSLKVGWEAYGTLNEAKDNVILITHYFSGTSHAAGRYDENDAAPGYWDGIIGPGKPLDTDKYYVIASDTLVNLNAKDPKVTTTGPATINPQTGEPWGLDFPIVTIRDFVEVQKALLESQGIDSLQAVMGASMGSLQAYEWASAYPEMVKRVIPVIGSGVANAYLIGWLNAWAAPIKVDPHWNGGDYYAGEPPTQGLQESLKLITLQANHWRWANDTYDRQWAKKGVDPASSLEARYLFEKILDDAAASRAKVADANHLLYLVKANQLFVTGNSDNAKEGFAAIEAPTLVIYSKDDLVFFPELVEKTMDEISADGTPVSQVVLEGDRGHLDGVLSIEQASGDIRQFLAQ
ncbi:homoserine O-acetyltransferase [Halomonas sp. PR-M31]|uniref:E22 family MetX-like putative esterase n=1 Tax=Halomonas sp. PR-M31 TaxID=1471202 RepID=UPI00069F099B|nr:homoserine O-acetyltransferase [Halomonas sp. PR-M31]